MWKCKKKLMFWRQSVLCHNLLYESSCRVNNGTKRKTNFQSKNKKCEIFFCEMVKGSLCFLRKHKDLASNHLCREGKEATGTTALSSLYQRVLISLQGWVFFCETCNRLRPNIHLSGPEPSMLYLFLHLADFLWVSLGTSYWHLHCAWNASISMLNQH